VLGHAERKTKRIKVRQPLKKLKIKNEKLKMTMQNLKREKYVSLVSLIKDELNVKEVEFIYEGKDKEIKVEFDTKLTPELIAEGEARELVRQIQDLRKKGNYKPVEFITVSAPSWPKEHEDYIKKRALVKELIKGDTLAIKQ